MDVSHALLLPEFDVKGQSHHQADDRVFGRRETERLRGNGEPRAIPTGIE